MLSAPQADEHGTGFLAAGRLAECHAVNDDDRVRRQDDRRAGLAGDRPRFSKRQPGDGIGRGPALQRLLNLTRNHLELSPYPTQKLPPSRGSRRQDQPHGSSRLAGGRAWGGQPGSV